MVLISGCDLSIRGAARPEAQVGPSSGPSSNPFSFLWDYTAGTEASYTLGANTEFMGSSAILSSVNQTDSSNAIPGFGSAVKTNTIWDTSYLRLTEGTGQPLTGEFDTTWTGAPNYPIAYWKLNGTAGANIPTGTTLTATAGPNGQLIAAGGPRKYIHGHLNQGIEFSANDGHIEVPTGTFTFSTGPITVSLWFLKNDDTTRGDLFNWKDELGGDTGIFVDGDELTVFPLGGADTTGTALSIGEWHHVIVTRDNSSNGTAYVDGKPYLTFSYPGDFTSLIGVPIWLASNHIGWAESSNFIGSIDEVAIWQKHFTPADVAEIYAHQAAQFVDYNDATLTRSWFNTTGMIAQWSMDNDWIDSVAAITGNPIGGATFSANGKVGSKSGVFDGVDDYVDLGGGFGNFGTSSFSIMGWIQPIGTDQQSVIIKKTDGTMWMAGIAGTNSFTFPAGRRLQFLLFNGANYRGGYTNTDVADGKWHHFAVVADAINDEVRVFVDGIQVPITMDWVSGTWPNVTNTGTVLLGKDDINGAPFTGRMDEISVWSRVLTASEIASVYGRQSGKHTGMIYSRVMDALSIGQSWTQLNWTTTLPFMKELPDYNVLPQNERSADYSALVGESALVGDDNLMNSSAGLFHLNGVIGSTILNSDSFADNSVSAQSPVANNANGTGMRFAPSPLGQGVYFDGVDDTVDIGVASLSVSTGLTVSAWVNSTSDAHDARIVSKHDASYGWILSRWITDYGAAEFRLSTNGSNWLGGFTAPGSFPSNEWVHVTATYDGSFMRVYFNGVEHIGGSFPVAASGSINDAGQLLRIGSDGMNVSYFEGAIDEVAIWRRALTPLEIAQLYRRGANRLKFQVRVCTAADCSDDLNDDYWVGPDGTRATFFSELNNRSIQDVVISGLVIRNGAAIDLLNFTAPGVSRYFQYRTIFESDDTSDQCDYGNGPTWCSPELETVAIGPNHYTNATPTVVTLTGQAFDSLTNFTEVGASCAGGLKYNLSVDQVVWYYWNGSAWAISNSTLAQANDASTIATHISSFDTEVGTGTLYIKTHLPSNGAQGCELDGIQVDGTGP